MFTYHDIESAPKESKPLIEQSQKNMGMLPNLHKVLVEAPATYETYNTALVCSSRTRRCLPWSSKLYL